MDESRKACPFPVVFGLDPDINPGGVLEQTAGSIPGMTAMDGCLKRFMSDTV